MRKLFALLTASLFAFAAQSASAAVMTFDGSSSGTTYTEAGMTITANTAAPVVVNGDWQFVCCSNTGKSFTLTTGGIFDLVSVFRLHVDSIDAVTFRGFLAGTEVATTSYNSGQGSDLLFSGFTGLDEVIVSVAGTFNDPRFDNLTFNAAAVNAVPEPGSLALLGLGLAGLAAIRKRKQA